jgi:hypothetical protein
MKKLLKRILLILLAVLIAVQAPFIYRRYKIGQLAGKIEELNRQRVLNNTVLPSEWRNFKEYKGIIHAHTNLGGHSTGSFDELIAAANANDLDFVIMTEHWSDTVDTAALTLNGVYGKTLFIGGNEIDTADGDRFLMSPGSGDAAGLRKMPTSDVIGKLHSEDRLAIVTYPEKFKSWDSNFDGIEVFSLHTNAKKMNPFTALFDGIWSFPAYPELMLASYFKRPDENLRKFDEVAASRYISLSAGADAHSNIGFHLFGDETGNKIFNLKIDDYATIFRLARQHVLVETDKPFTKDTLIEAIRLRRSFIGFDVLCDTTGFRFWARREDDPDDKEITGSSSMLDPLPPYLIMKATSPATGRFVLFRDGGVFHQSELTTEFALQVPTPGVYRVEVYLDQLGPPFDKMPWIISNPIYLR